MVSHCNALKMFSLKVIFVLACSLVLAAALPNDGIIGGEQPLTGDSLAVAENTLQESLKKLAAGDGPNYKLSKIISATSQVVSGVLYKYETELNDSANKSKKCKISIWSQPWLENGIEVTFNCEGEEKQVKKHSA